MNRTVRNTAFVLSALILLPVIAQAQIKDNFEINVFGGGSFYTDKKFEVGFPQITGSVLGPAATTAPIQGAFRFTNALRGGLRSEERRVGKECRAGGSREESKK